MKLLSSPSALLFLAFTSHVTLTASARCPFDGALLPRPTYLGSSPLVQDAGKNLSTQLDSVVSGQIQAGWAVENISFSLALVSLNDSKPFWEYHHRASANVNGTRTVDGDSQYLIGSLSKVFTDLILLKVGLPLEDKITKYLPELESEDSPIRWNQVSLGALAYHLAGIPPNYGFPEVYSVVQYYEALGFPALSPVDFSSCGIAGLNGECSKQQLLEGLKKSHPVSPPNLRPVYSSISFTLISYAVQNATGKNFTQLLKDEITTPLSLESTMESPGDSSEAIIPPLEMNGWGADYGDNAPGGGLVSTTNDLSKLAHSILTRTVLSSAKAVLAWLKPASSTSSPANLVGAPWEIYRTANLTPEHPHTIDAYAKDGAGVGYEARFALLDQYGVGAVLLTAGGRVNEALNPLTDAVLASFVPAIEEATREEADAYKGSYNASDASGVDGSMVVELDEGPGLRLLNLSRNGSDILEGIRTVWDAQVVNPGNLSSEFRLYPADIVNETTVAVGGDQVPVVEEDWRMQLDALPVGLETELPGTSEQPFSEWCASWQTIDSLYYGGEPVDRFVFVREKGNGNVLSVRVPFLRMEFQGKDE